MKFETTFIHLPLNKMAGCPWNLLDNRGMRVAWCGTDNNHEKDGELIANDILNLVAIGEAASELLEKGNAQLIGKDAEIGRLKEVCKESLRCMREAKRLLNPNSTNSDADDHIRFLANLMEGQN